MVEFAIVLPVLVLIICGIIDFGRALFTLNNLTSAAREGARFGAVQAGNGSTLTGTDLANIRTRVQQNIQNFQANPPAYTINVTVATGATGAQLITVSITGYTFQWVTPLPGLVGFSAPTFPPVSATFRWERS